MADTKKKNESAKGRKIGRNLNKCAGYRSRNNMGFTAKARRVARALAAGLVQPGWILTEAGRGMPYDKKTRKVRPR